MSRTLFDTSSTELTEHERQVMQLVCERRSNDEIGRLLNLSDDTVKLHVHSIYRKLVIYNRMTLAAMAADLSPNVGDDRHQAGEQSP